MANAELQHRLDCQYLVGLFLVVTTDGPYAIVLERSTDTGLSTLTILGPGRGGDRGVQRTLSERETGVRALDGQLHDGTLLFCLERNGDDAVQWTQSSLTGLLDEEHPPAFFPVWRGGLNDVDAEEVDAVAAGSWNVISLPSHRWLFEPRFVRGSTIPEIVFGTADRRIALLRPSATAVDAPAQARWLPPGARGFGPHACLVAGAVVSSWLYHHQPGLPYDLSNARMVGKTPGGATLLVHEQGRPVRDLGHVLDLGPVIEHTMALDADGHPWIFAIRDAPVGTEVVALQRSGPEQWVHRDTKRFTRDLWRLDAVSTGPGAWHLAVGERSPDGWSVHDLPWPGCA